LRSGQRIKQKYYQDHQLFTQELIHIW